MTTLCASERGDFEFSGFANENPRPSGAWTGHPHAQDLSKLDFSQFKPARFEFERKDEQINMRVPKPLLAAVKARAKARGIP